MGRRPSPSTRRASAPSAALTALLAQQRDRWILWLPMAVIAGAALWLLAPRDPPAWWAPATLVSGAIAAWLFAAWPSASPSGFWNALRAALAALCAMAAAIGIGATAADIRTRTIAAPRLEQGVDGVQLEGWVTMLEGGARPRMRILVRALEGEANPPRFVRVSVPPRMALNSGRALRCRVSLEPPAAPLAPGAYDFARRAYFMRLGAVGYAQGRCRPILIDPPAPLWDRFIVQLGALRGDLSAAIQEASPGRGGAIAAALIAGDESGIDEPTDETLRDSGLGHILSVSGLHMSVVGGLMFGALLLVFSLIPPIALRVPARKVAAAGALITLAIYLVVSGSSMPAIRAFVMAAVAFGAILIDRPAISMRGLALAAFLIVLAFPESVLEPGFQMSFAATAALVAAFEASRRPPEENALPTPGPLIGGLQNIGRALGLIMITSLVAGLATDPFAYFHFQRFAVYGLAANLAVAPIVTFVVAPIAGLAAIAAPFGLADAPLQFLGSALDLVAAIGAAFGDRPEAVRALPKPPEIFLPLASLAVAWGCLWRGALRWGALLPLGAAVALAIIAPQPVLALDDEARAVFTREQGANEWRLMRTGRSPFARERLGGQLGLTPDQVEELSAPETCSEAACTWTMPSGRIAALIHTPEGFAEACIPRAIIVSAHPAPAIYAARCRPTLLLDASELRREGGALIYETENGLSLTRAQPAIISRAWTSSY